MTRENALDGFNNMLKELEGTNDLFVGTINPELIKMAIYALEQPEIIRCMDCRHIRDNDCPIYWGKSDYDFCSFAEE